MSPSLAHEEINDALRLLVNVICEERELDVKGAGSTTHKRADLLKGLDPDSCFYIQNVDAIAGQRRLDLSFLPPADLAIEIDTTHPSLPKLPIYAAIGVPEVWLYSGGQVRFMRLVTDHYVESEESSCLPGILATDITMFVNESAQTKRPEWLRKVRRWVRSLD